MRAAVMRWMRRAALGAAAVVALGAAARTASPWFVFPAWRVAAPAVPDDFEPLALTAADGTAVHAMMLHAARGAPVLVHFHGNREAMTHNAALGRALHARGFEVVLAEYRGYGASSGPSPDEQGLYLDAEAVLAELAARGIGPERTVLWGTSLGTGVASEMARRKRGAALVLVAPFTSIGDVVAGAVGVDAARLLVRDSFDTLSKSAEIAVPTLIVHGDQDEVVPVWMGERLEAALGHARLVRVAGGHHGDVLARGGPALLDAVVDLARAARPPG